ncbi:MAG: Zn-dependent exopeptidase M28 [Oscillospiraceae bacterium]|jgi:hypothetical protein|nr:Zn-dependent exopeptidase M28 [Oscillospiraceae bacterium]
MSEIIQTLEQDLCLEERFRVRRSPEVKRAFYAYVSAFLNERGWQGRTDGDFKKTGNLIFGDERKAKVILGAHFDTPKTGYTAPNFFITNNRGYAADWVIGAGILTTVFGGATVAYKAAKHFGKKGAPWAAGWLGLMAAYTWASFTVDNKFNFNDNTSGCIALLTIADAIAKEHPELRDDIAIVFFDKEESGLIGSKKFNQTLQGSLSQEELSKKLLLNFDCVGGRDPVFRLYSRPGKGIEIAKQIRRHSDREDFVIHETNHFPSDSSSFKSFPAISFISVKKHKWPGFEKLGDTHSNKDNYLNVDMIQEYADLAVRFLGNYL